MRIAFQTVEDANSFVQLSAVSKEGSAAIQTLRNAISDMKSELEEEKDDIEASARKCEKDANNLLETAKQKAEQMDGFAANIASLEKKKLHRRSRSRGNSLRKLQPVRRSEPRLLRSTTKRWRI